MENINELLLKSNLRDQTNKNVSSSSCDDTMLQFFKTKTNLFYHIKNKMKLYELSQWIISIKQYLERKNGNLHTTNYTDGSELIIDFGIAYGQEMAYRHHAIVLAQRKNKIFVLPLSSQTHRAIDNNGKVKYEYLVGGTSEGFTKEGIVCLLHDTRWISLNRVLSNANNSINALFLEEIKDAICRRALGTIHQEFISTRSHNKKLIKNIEYRKKQNQQISDKLSITENCLNDKVIELDELNIKYKELLQLCDELKSKIRVT